MHWRAAVPYGVPKGTVIVLHGISDDGAKAFDDFTLMTRDDGTLQWAYKGRPLYQSANDKQPGDHKGDGFRGIWHLVKP